VWKEAIAVASIRAEQVRLIEEYEDARETYFGAIQLLGSKGETAEVREYMELRRASDEARMEAELAWQCLEKLCAANLGLL
jgi:hypothetical protein